MSEDEIFVAICFIVGIAALYAGLSTFSGQSGHLATLIGIAALVLGIFGVIYLLWKKSGGNSTR